MKRQNRLNLHGMWHVQIINDGKVDHDFMCPNGIVDEGIEYLLDTGFHNGTKLTPWYLGIIDNISYTTLDDADVMTSHGGWIEFILYTGGVRPTWAMDAAADRAITNSTPIDITISAVGNLRGLFVTSGSALSGTSGTLWATAIFGAVYPVANGTVIRLTYIVSG